MNKEETDEHLTSYMYARSDKTQLVYMYILRDLADKKVRSILNGWDSSKVDWDLDYLLNRE
jgi:glycogen synthase